MYKGRVQTEFWYSQIPFINANTEGAIDSVRINNIYIINIYTGWIWKNVRAFFSQGQTKLSVTMNCPYYAGFRRAGLTVLLEGMNKQLY